MAKYKATVNTALGADQSFGLMADFANAEHWDPATKESKQLDDAPIGVGSKFNLTMQIAGRENDIVYEIIEYDAPHKVVLRGENSGSVAIDTITVSGTADGSSITYDADVSMKGAFKVIGPFFGPVFKKMGDQARDKMGEWLDGQAAGGA